MKPASQTLFLLMFLASCNSDTEIETVDVSLESLDAQATLSAPPMSEIITENAQAIQEVSSSLDDLDGSIQKNTQAIEKLSADLAIADNSSLTSLNTQLSESTPVQVRQQVYLIQRSRQLLTLEKLLAFLRTQL